MQKMRVNTLLTVLISSLSLCSAVYFPPNSDVLPCPSPLPANGLVDQWLFNGTFKDTVGCNTFVVVEGDYALDVYFQGNQYGYGVAVLIAPLYASGVYIYNTYKAPQGTYFNGDFTVTVNLRMLTCDSGARVLDFGNGKQNDNVALLASDGTSCKPKLIVYSGTSASSVVSSQALITNLFYDLTYMVKGTTGYIYVDGVLTGSGPIFSPRNVIRTSNYLGKSNWASDGHFNGHLSNLTLYKRALTTTEITAFPVGYGLVNYYPFNWDYPQDFRDQIRRDLMSGETRLTSENYMVGGASDRFGYEEWALNFAQGYLRAATSTYFYGGNFTICAWFQVIRYNKCHRLMDFSTSGNDNNRVGIIYSIF